MVSSKLPIPTPQPGFALRKLLGRSYHFISMNEESSGLQFGKFGLSKKRFRSLAGDRDIWQGAFSQRLPVRTVVSSLGERNPTQEIPRREGRDLNRRCGGERWSQRNGDRYGPEWLGVTWKICRISGERSVLWVKKAGGVCLKVGA